MNYIECPSTGMSSENCDWIPRKGEVRDAPGVGVRECRKCQLVTHASDLRHHVNYQGGSVHRWAAGYGENLPQVSSDSERRVDAIRALDAIHSIKSVLDFGCGSGSMLLALGEHFDAYGIEPDLIARESAIQQGGRVWESVDKLGESINNQFDLVTLFHVVEHFYQPFEELQRIKSLLRPGASC